MTSPLLHQCPPTLPAAICGNAGWLARERAGIWRRDWICAGRLADRARSGPEATRLTAEWLFGAETLAQPGFDAAEVAAFAGIVLRQDAKPCEMNQRGLHSPAHRQVTLMPQAFDLHAFHQWVLQRIAP